MSRAAFRSLGLALGLILGSGVQALPAQGSPSATVVYLVRHAEKVDESADPELSAVGRARAVELAWVLSEAGITTILSTDFLRTRGTAEPLATALGVKVEIYDPRAAAATVSRIRSLAGPTLVVGHSNTTPGLVTALGGDPHGTIADSEYDRLYIVVLTGEQVTTTLLRYGAPSP